MIEDYTDGVAHEGETDIGRTTNYLYGSGSQLVSQEARNPRTSDTGNVTNKVMNVGTTGTRVRRAPLKYDEWNRVAGIDLNNDSDFTDANEGAYAYDGLGRRIVKDSATGSTQAEEDASYNDPWQAMKIRRRTRRRKTLPRLSAVASVTIEHVQSATDSNGEHSTA